MDNPNKSLHETIPDAIDCTEATDGNKHNIFFVGISFYKLESGTKTEHYYYQYHYCRIDSLAVVAINNIAWMR